MKKLFLAAVAVSALSIASTAVMAHNHMGKGDTDGDGQMSKAEFMAKHEERFMVMDVDGDGFISKDEHKAAKMERKDKMNKMKDKMMEKKSDY